MLSEAYRLNQDQKMCYIGGFPAWAFKYTDWAGGSHGDVATEWEFSRLISAYNAFKDADAIGFGALANASFWQHFPLEDQYPQHWVTRDELLARGYLDSAGHVDEARQYSRKAKNWCIAGLVIGLVWWIVYAVLLMAGVAWAAFWENSAYYAACLF